MTDDMKLPSTLRTELADMTKLADELRLALARQREVNETMVKALDEAQIALPELLRHLRSTNDPLALDWTQIHATICAAMRPAR